MTKKDYILIAAALKRSALPLAPEWTLEAVLRYQQGNKAAIYQVAEALATDNTRFDRGRFLAACGVQS